MPMLIGAIFLLLAIWSGIAILRLLPLRWYRIELLAAGIAGGLLLATWISFLSVLLLGYKSGLPVAAALVVMVAAAAEWRVRVRRHNKPLYGDWKAAMPATLVWVVFSIFTAVLTGILFESHMLHETSEGMYSGVASYGDVILHSSLITHFAAGDSLDMTMPIFAEVHNTYPFFMDYLSAVLVKMGWSLQASLALPGWLLVMAFMQLMFFLSYRLFGSGWAATLGVLLFFFNGSLAGIAAFWRDLKASEQPLGEFLRQLPQDYSNIAEANLRFSNVISTQLLPQRGTDLAYPLMCLVLILLVAAWKAKGREAVALLAAAAVVTGLMPMVHVHTVIFLLGVMCVLALGKSWQTRRLAWVWLLTPLAAGLISLPQVYWVFLSVPHATGFSRGHIGWTREPGQDVLAYWWRNFGLWLVWLAALPIALWQWRAPALWRYLFMVSAGFLAFANLYIMQPWAYDNFKIIALSMVGISMLAAYVVVRVIRAAQWTIPVGVLVISLMCLPGALSVGKELQTANLVFSRTDMAVAKWVSANTPADAIFITPTRHNQPITALAGRSTVMGYQGWLWSYGLNYAPTEADVGNILAGSSDAGELLRARNVSYIALHGQEMFSGSSLLAARYPTVYISADRTYRILKVR